MEFSGVFWGQNLPPPKKTLKIPFCCVNFLRNISNDFLMSYMIETDVEVCVLICLDVYVGSEDQRLVKNKQKIADLVP